MLVPVRPWKIVFNALTPLTSQNIFRAAVSNGNIPRITCIPWSCWDKKIYLVLVIIVLSNSMCTWMNLIIAFLALFKQQGERSESSDLKGDSNPDPCDAILVLSSVWELGKQLDIKGVRFCVDIKVSNVVRHSFPRIPPFLDLNHLIPIPLTLIVRMALVGSFSCNRTSAKTFMLFCFNLVVNWFESCKMKKYRVSLLTEGSRARDSFDPWNNDETWARKLYLPLSSPHCPHRWSRPHATRMLWRTLFLARLVMPLMLSSVKSWGAGLVFSQVPNRWFHKKTARNKRNRNLSGINTGQPGKW